MGTAKCVARLFIGREGYLRSSTRDKRLRHPDKRACHALEGYPSDLERVAQISGQRN